MLLAVPLRHRRQFDRYVMCAFVVFLGSIFVDAYYPGTFSLVLDRAAGFGDNPNTAGFVLVLLCCCVVNFAEEQPKNLVVIALTSLGVLVTLSRGAFILLSVVFVFYGYRVMDLNLVRPLRLLRRAAILALFVTAIFGSGALLVNRADIFALSYQPRLQMLSGSEEVVEVDDSRIEVLKIAVEAVSRSPVLGYGTGYTYSMPVGPHNIYVQQWLNNGLPGLFAYLMFIGTCVRAFWKRRFSRGLIFMAVVVVHGFFNHNILEERAFLALLGILLTVSFYGWYATDVSYAVEPGLRTTRAPFRHQRPAIRHVIDQTRVI